MVSQSFTLPSGSKLYRRNQGTISLIYPNDDNKSFIRQCKSSYLVYHISSKFKVSYPIGRHMWKVTDRRCGSFGEAIEKPLTITICKENEFTCDDGTCQDLGNR